jgi:hypothetical protein
MFALRHPGSGSSWRGEERRRGGPAPQPLAPGGRVLP